jgi:hypothetical protein
MGKSIRELGNDGAVIANSATNMKNSSSLSAWLKC